MTRNETGDNWYRSAVTYQLYIRSFADSDGDGLGDITGIRSRLPYLAALGVDAVWINPWYPSPQADGGYDVADYRDVHAPFGDLDQAKALIREAHAVGLKVLLDIVPNHTSDEHPWFAAALAGEPGARERYIFRPGTGDDGELPPNDWQSVFGGSAWQRVAGSADWYLHLFDVRQPDLNWDNPQVRAEFESVLRFWFDLGADGFRIDVAHGLIKDPALPNLNLPESELLDRVRGAGHPYWDRPGVLEVWQEWRRVGDSYDPPRVFVAEAWVESSARLAEYLRPERLHTAFDFELMRARWSARELRDTARASLEAHDSVGAPVMWTLSNHDVTRHVTRLGRAQRRTGAQADAHSWPEGPSDLELGTRRARAAILYVLALPGGVYLYQGEELGLPEIEDLPDELLQDPTWQRSGHTQRGRDGCRVPIPWARSGPSFGFGDGEGWLPQPPSWGELSVEAEQGDPGSMLSLYRQALRVRRELPQLGAGGGPLVWTGEEDQVLGLTRGQGFICMLNTGEVAVPLPPGRVVLSSLSVDGGLLPPDAAAWIVTG
ncbi:glycoside hydrolase family 13 protein [Kineosporia sp. J2-2]|uniref:Glycoside hydrolase family 13 protein n=1 Tax=Kineosporia corallincola TaxID=2835133 RepID=A0ABS5TM90_9ACTN|nr:glycoside hydrolase family 13 protein [Kineosporia corallincola]MBT0772219.1 glycoside hydrolase family 13 protein [Kineosporia corallincola]